MSNGCLLMRGRKSVLSWRLMWTAPKDVASQMMGVYALLTSFIVFGFEIRYWFFKFYLETSFWIKFWHGLTNAVTTRPRCLWTLPREEFWNSFQLFIKTNNYLINVTTVNARTYYQQALWQSFDCSNFNKFCLHKLQWFSNKFNPKYFLFSSTDKRSCLSLKLSYLWNRLTMPIKRHTIAAYQNKSEQIK